MIAFTVLAISNLFLDKTPQQTPTEPNQVVEDETPAEGTTDQPSVENQNSPTDIKL